MKTIEVGKTRKIRGFKNETWIACKIKMDFQEEPTVEDIENLNSTVEEILIMEENNERQYWFEQQESRRSQEGNIRLPDGKEG